MRLIENESEVAAEIKKAEAYWENLSAQNISTQQYHEMSETPVTDTDPLAQLSANLETLADLHGRLAFVMREVKYLVKA